MKADCKKLEGFRSQMVEREYTDLSSINVAIAHVSEEVNEKMDQWCENICAGG